MDLSRSADGWAGAKCSFLDLLLSKIYYKYPTMIEIGTVISNVGKIKNL